MVLVVNVLGRFGNVPGFKYDMGHWMNDGTSSPERTGRRDVWGRERNVLSSLLSVAEQC